MPTVPAAQRTQQLQGLPNAQLTAAATVQSEGGQSDDPVARALEGVGAKTAAIGEQAYGEIVARERKRADDIAVLNASAQLAAWENRRIYDTEKGALTVRGKDSFGLPEQISGEYNDQADKIEASLSPTQKDRFRRIRVERGIDLDGTIQKHTYSQIQQYQAQELDAYIANSQDAAIANATDPRRIGTELSRQEDAIRSHAKFLGLGPEQIQEKVKETQSKTHVGVIENLLAQEKPKAAQIYFDETKSQIKGEAIARIEKALQEGGVRKEAQTQADTIIKAGGTLSDMRDKAKAIDNPEVRDNVQSRIEHEWDVRNAQQRQDDEQAAKTAATMIERNIGKPARNVVPPTAWNAFSPGMRASLDAYATKLAKGEPIDTDYPTYYGLMQKAGATPTDFANLNLLQYRGKLGDTEFKQLTEIQLSIRNKDGKSERDLGDFRTKDELIKDSLTQYGIETREAQQTADQKQAVAQLRRMVDVRSAAIFNATGKKPNNQDIQSVIDQILGQKNTVEGSWWNIWPGSGPFFTRTTPLVSTTIQDVPEKEKDDITAALRRAGRPITDQTILDLYVDRHSRQQGGK